MRGDPLKQLHLSNTASICAGCILYIHELVMTKNFQNARIATK